MEQTNKAVLVKTLGEFEDIKAENDFTNEMCDRALEIGLIPGDSEITSWKENYDALKALFLESNLPDDVVIAFEYQVPIGGGRIDCMLFGHGNDGHANIIHVELKQWSEGNVTPYYDHHTYKADVIVDGYKNGSKYISHPCEQVSGYDNVIRNHVKALEENDINIYGFAYCYKYKLDDKNCALFDCFYEDIIKEYPLFCKGQKEEFSKKLNYLLCQGKGEKIYKAFILVFGFFCSIDDFQIPSFRFFIAVDPLD